MSISRKPKIPIDCPACEGIGLGTDGETCWSCRGSKVWLVSEAVYAKIHGLVDKMERHRLYTDEEKKIIMGAGKRREKLKLLISKGYDDRTYGAIGAQAKKWRDETREKAGA
jgi:DnaJ-class molecular chaperone